MTAMTDVIPSPLKCGPMRVQKMFSGKGLRANMIAVIGKPAKVQAVNTADILKQTSRPDSCLWRKPSETGCLPAMCLLTSARTPQRGLLLDCLDVEGSG